MVRIVVGGDICPMGKVERLFAAGDASRVYQDLLPDIQNADISVANLECPLVTASTPTAKAGPVLSAGVDCAKGLAAAGWSAANLANNHSYDHGRRGLSSTIDALKRAGVPHFGAGADIEEAKRPHRAKADGHEIVFYPMAEQEFSVARDDRGGSNPLDMIAFVEAIRTYKRDGLFVVLVHGGVEYYPFPTPEMQRRCRFMIDMGASAVVCCHAHCPQPWEVYKGRPIVYGLGNLVFEADRTEPKAWYEGYLAELTVVGDDVQFRPIPYIQSLGGPGVQKMTADQAGTFLTELEKRASLVTDPTFLRRQMARHCSEKETEYLARLFGYSRAMAKFARVVMPALHPTEKLFASLLLVRCESHREVLDTILEEKCRTLETQDAKRS